MDEIRHYRKDWNITITPDMWDMLHDLVDRRLGEVDGDYDDVPMMIDFLKLSLGALETASHWEEIFEEFLREVPDED